MGNLLIVVIYTENILVCTTVTSLLKVDSAHLRDIGIYFYINGKRDFSREIREMFHGRCKYLHTFYDGKNRGIVYAYKKAVMEEGKNFEWITFLDQDSVFDDRYIKVITHLSKYHFEQSTVAIVPIVKATDEIQLSPSRIFLGKGMPYSSRFGYPTCINSMTTFRSSFLIEMAQNFPVDFFLDAFDNWLFYQGYKRRLGLHLLEDVVVYHNISLINAELNDTYWAREFMSVINTSRISFTFFPLAALRFIWRLFRMIWQRKDIRYLNLMRIYSKYRFLKRGL